MSPTYRAGPTRARTLKQIAHDVLCCAVAWDADVRVVGNVRADELARLAKYVVERCQCDFRTRMVGDGCEVCGDRDGTP